MSTNRKSDSLTLLGYLREFQPESGRHLVAEYYRLIARSVAELESSTADSRRAVYRRARGAQATQLRNVDPPLSESDLRRERQALENAIRAIETLANAKAHALSDATIVADYKIFIENTNPRIDCFYDANMMPHPKQTIVAAIERQIVQEPMDSRVEWLRAASRCLWNFLEAVDSAPAPSMAIDLDRVLRTAPESVVQQIVGQFCAIEDEQNEPFRAKAKRENQEIEARITAAIHIRDELLTAMRCGNAAAD